MILADCDIKKAINNGDIIIKPQPNFDSQLSSCSLDLHLGSQFLIYQYSILPFIDIKKEIPSELMKQVDLKNQDEYFIIQPGEFVLGATDEWVELSDKIAARLEGRSSIGRLGIVIHATASLIPPGWRGKIVLELGNIARIPVALYPKMRICALTFEQVSSTVNIPYFKKKNAKYANQKGPAVSRINFD